MPQFSPAEAAENLELVVSEVKRLNQFFAQRDQTEKRLKSKLDVLVPKLKRLAKGAALLPVKGATTSITAEELAMLADLKPTPKA